MACSTTTTTGESIMLLGKTIRITAQYDTTNPDRVLGTGTCSVECTKFVQLEGRQAKFPRSMVGIEVLTTEPEYRMNSLPLTNMPTPNGIRKKRSPKQRAHMHHDYPEYIHYSRLEMGVY